MDFFYIYNEGPCTTFTEYVQLIFSDGKSLITTVTFLLCPINLRPFKPFLSFLKVDTKSSLLQLTGPFYLT